LRLPSPWDGGPASSRPYSTIFGTKPFYVSGGIASKAYGNTSCTDEQSEPKVVQICTTLLSSNSKKRETKMNETEMRQDLERLVISLDNAMRMKRGEIKENPRYDIHHESLVKTLRAKYGISAKSWPVTKKKEKIQTGDE
jgi:hypothetical protein